MRKKFKDKIPGMNSSEWYHLIRKVCGLNPVSAIDKIKLIDLKFSQLTDKELADVVNSHFSLICNTFDECESISLCPLPLDSSPIKVSAHEVARVIRKLNKKKSNCPNLVPTELIKYASNFLDTVGPVGHHPTQLTACYVSCLNLMLLNSLKTIVCHSI